MPPLHQQRSVLLDTNAKLIREWLRKLGPERQLDVLKSLLRNFSLAELQAMQAHVNLQVKSDDTAA
jgi:CHAD domain-containing protein